MRIIDAKRLPRTVFEFDNLQSDKALKDDSITATVEDLVAHLQLNFKPE